MKAAATLRAGALVAALVVAGGCGNRDAGGGGQIRLPDGTPVVIVSIDTLRSDRLPAYGYDAVETPAIDALRREAILFAHAYAPVPLTLPSHATLLTGASPPEHGIRDNMGYELAAALPYLPALLADAGYRTGAAVSALVLRGETGLERGFEIYEDDVVPESWVVAGSAQRDGLATLERVRPWLAEATSGPFFLFFHLYEPHLPRTPPEPFAARYGATSYDAEVAAADAVVGALFDELRRLGVYEKSLIVLVSDHGEGLGEHGEPEHGPFVYREALQVPLLVKLPGGERGGETISAPAELGDVAPTILDLLGMPRPEGVGGPSLLALDADGAAGGAAERALYGESYFPRLHFGWSELRSMIVYPYHLIDGPDPELYDLANDPGELENLLPGERRAYARLRDALAAVPPRFQAPADTDPALREQLAALGYVGAAAPRAGPLPDPKAKLETLAAIRAAFGHFHAGRYPQAVAAFRAILTEEPALTDMWESLGHSLLRLDRPEEARQAYTELFELTGAPHAALALAGAELRVGRLDEARAHAALATAAFPSAHDLLAQIALREGRSDEALAAARRAVAASPSSPGPRVTEAQALLALGRHREALDASAAAEARLDLGDGRQVDPNTVRGLYLIRGQALANLGRAEEAEAAFRREIELSPATLAAYSHLAVLQALTGDAAAVTATLRRMVESNPRPQAYAEAAQTFRVLGDAAAAERLLAFARQRWPGDPALRNAVGSGP